MLPFERFQAAPEGPPRTASPTSNASPLRGSSNTAGVANNSGGAPNNTTTGSSYHSYHSVRPHSRPAALQGQSTTAPMVPSQPRVRHVMMPSSPSRPARGGSPDRCGQTSSPTPLTSNSNGSYASPTTAAARPQLHKAARPLPPGGPRALAVVDGGGGRSALANAAVASSSSSAGVSVADLSPEIEVTLNLKAFSIDKPLPVNDPTNPTAPKFTVAVDSGVLELNPNAANAPPGMTTSLVRDSESNSNVLVDQIVVPNFCKFVVDSDEVGRDRCLQFHAFVEVPEMFASPPAITADGTLTCVVSRSFTGPGSQVWIRLADNAAVLPSGEIATSEPFPVYFSVPGRAVGQRAVPKAKDWHSFKSKATATCVSIDPVVSTASNNNNRSSTAAPRPLSPHSMTTASSSALSTSAAGSPAAAAPAVVERLYEFPLNNIHALREPGLDIGPVRRGPHAPATEPAATSMTAPRIDVRLPLLASTGDAQRVGLAFLNPVTDVERQRAVHHMMERDRLAGDAVADEGQRQAMEQKLKQKLAALETEASASDPQQLDLAAASAPVLTRLAQLALVRGAKGVGDAVELFERVVRLRMRFFGMTSYDDAGKVAAMVKSSSATSSSATAAEALVQSMIVLASVMKHVARFADGVPVATAAAKIARDALGLDHNGHLRALAQIGELWYLAGDYSRAATAYRTSLEQCTILLGSASASAVSVRHLLGACLTALERPDEAMALHAEAVAVREAAHRAALEKLPPGPLDTSTSDTETLKLRAAAAQAGFQLAESLAFAARCYRLSGDLNAALDAAERADALADEVETSANAEFATSSATIASITASVYSAAGKDRAALSVLLRAANAVATARGRDTVEYAVASFRVAVTAISALCREKRASDLTPANLAELDLLVIRNRLTRVVAVFGTAFGAQHPTTARAAIVLAQLQVAIAQSAPSPADNAAALAAAAAAEEEDDAVSSSVSSSSPRLAAVGALEGTSSNSERRQLMAAAFANAERSHRHLEHALGALHRDTGAAAEAVASTALACGDDAAAGRYLASAIAVARACRLATRIQRLVSQLLLVHGRLRRPIPEEIAVTAEETYARVRSALGETAPACLEPLRNLAEVSYAAGELERAHHFLTKALKIADSNNMIFLLGPLFKPAAQLSTADVAERNRLAANRLDRHKAIDFAGTLFSIACVFEAQKRSNEAQSTLLQVLAALELAGRPVSIYTAETLCALGKLLYRDGFYGDALAYCEKALAMLLDHFPNAKDRVAGVQAAIHAIDAQTRAAGYTLVRHAPTRFRFAVYL